VIKSNDLLISKNMLSEQRELKSNSILKTNETVLISILRIIIIQNKRLEIKIKKFFK